jgi:hypothetical protein
MVPADMNPLFQQMGAVAEGLRALSDSLELRHAQVDRLHDLLRKEVGILSQDQRDLAEKVDRVICVMQHDLEGLRTEALVGDGTMHQLVAVVQELQKPVAEIVALRSKIAGLILGLGIIGSAAVWLGEPIYRWFITNNYFKQ